MLMYDACVITCRKGSLVMIIPLLKLAKDLGIGIELTICSCNQLLDLAKLAAKSCNRVAICTSGHRLP